MIYPREVIPQNLEHALLATRVLAALEYVQLKKAPAPQGALDEAKRFFEIVIDARDRVKEREFSTHSWEGALAYGEAIRAIEKLPELRENTPQLMQVLKDLSGVVKSLQERRPAPEEKLQFLMHFFRLVRDISFESDERQVEHLQMIQE